MTSIIKTMIMMTAIMVMASTMAVMACASVTLTTLRAPPSRTSQAARVQARKFPSGERPAYANTKPGVMSGQ